MTEQNTSRILDDTFIALTDIHGRSTALQELVNYLQCSRISAQDLDYESLLSVFDSAMHFITDQVGDLLCRIETSEMDIATE